MQNDTPIDMLQIKIERAKENLPLETRKAIDAVDWRAFVLSMREKKGYSFEQLEELELETELLLCGLLPPENYPGELEKEMEIPRSQVDLLVNEMNEFVFKKIREELIKGTERKELFVPKTETLNKNEPTAPPKNTHTIEDIIKKPTEPISLQKLTSSFQIPTIKTEYSLNSFKKQDILHGEKKSIVSTDKIKTSRDDPYRLDPNAE